ncbi:MAG: ribonuclease P protein component [Bacteroidales bacterium]|nr:ribonuclease P protein component [Bacteroidales bacterium]
MPLGDAKQNFPRRNRIKSSLLIHDIVTSGDSLFSHPIKCYYRRAPEGSSETALAVVVPKRRFRHAVDRNRLKRLMREAYRTHKFQDAAFQMCWIYVGKEIATYEEVCHAVIHIHNKLKTLS